MSNTRLMLTGHCQYEMEPLSVGISIDVSPEKVPTMSITLLYKPSDQDEIKEILSDFSSVFWKTDTLY